MEYEKNRAGLFLHDDRLARICGVGPIPVCTASSGQPLLDETGHASPYLVDSVLAKHLPNHRTKPDREGVSLTTVNLDYFHSSKEQTLVNARHVFHVAADTVQGLHDDHFELASPRGVQHLPKPIAPVHRAARTGFVFKASDDAEILPARICYAKVKLILCRPFVL
ncbi:hypothetical protein ASG39_11175 [Rhizobium sp. Leaf371]|nr:hypothetical protein ASG39_11175 [Rhizobium sp. Leaf371]